MTTTRFRAFVPRRYHNTELRALAGQLPQGLRIINVSGWNDSDKEGSRYRDYFPTAATYHVSNHPGDAQRGANAASDLLIDLDRPIDPSLAGRYDLAFSHTVLEHVREPWNAFSQIARLTSDWLITLVPFKQKLHFEAGMYGDYYRFTPFSMRQFHESNGFHVLYESFTPLPSLDVYLLYVASRQPDKHPDFPRRLTDIAALNQRVGEIDATSLMKNVAYRFLAKFVFRAN